MKALVVDDDVISRFVLENILSRFGKVECCADGADAVRAGSLALDNGDPYDLICMDVIMPIMGGLEALQLIREEEERRERPRVTKVIVTTGSEDSDTITQAFHQLCDAYVVKPIDTEAFLNVLEYVCQVDRRRD